MVFEKEMRAEKEFDVLSFGEVMLRLSPPGKERISQGEEFEKKQGALSLMWYRGYRYLV